MKTIERKILDELKRNNLFIGKKITNILYHRTFVVVELNDGAIGTAMNYDNFPYNKNFAEKEEKNISYLINMIERDPVLKDTLLKIPSDKISLTYQAIKIAIFSALSSSLLNQESLERLGYRSQSISYQDFHFPVVRKENILHEILSEHSFIGIIGFGGILEIANDIENIKKIIVHDLRANHNKEEFLQQINQLNTKSGINKVYLSEKDYDDLSECSLIAITASAFSNGTMELLLNKYSNKKIIIQGPSGAILPSALLTDNVVLLCTEVKDYRFSEAYKFDERIYEWFIEFDDRLLITN